MSNSIPHARIFWLVTHCIVEAKVGCGPIWQVTDDHAVRLPAMLVKNYDVCEVVTPTGFHEL